MDIYKEYMVKQKRSAWIIAASVCLWGLAIACTPLAFTMSVVTYGLSVPFCAGIYFLAWWFTTNNNVEFEYIFTNGELDVDKISGKRNRKRYVTIAVSKFDVCERAEGERFENYQKDPSVKVRFDASKGPGTENRYYAVFLNKAGNRMLMLFSPTQELLENIKQYNPMRTVTD